MLEDVSLTAVQRESAGVFWQMSLQVDLSIGPGDSVTMSPRFTPPHRPNNERGSDNRGDMMALIVAG
ncbi:unnamed protein product [Protopolystoma xenopodis]|uniref:Uncharacterized protein n=1 Tax=Protopolystoma xenopodis TaxID=117903 RepID=A0A448XB45_9PLAT|nr:unnamed protein product [Protopolystoma xenopodis]